MSKLKTLQKLSKFIAYVLGRRPDEFGLAPDSEGFVKIKEFLKAVHEEEGFKYVRRSHIEELLITLPDPPVEITDSLIRAVNRDHLPAPAPAENLPKLLYTCVRRRAYPTVFEKGISPSGDQRVILSTTPELAERIGRRIDPKPVLLTVQTGKSIEQGIVFYTAGKTLFSAEAVHSNCFTGPPLPKQKIVPHPSEDAERGTRDRFPGSYFIDLKAPKSEKAANRRAAKGKDAPKDKGAKRWKRQKQRKERPPWRR